ncbi:MAG: SRPBCC domain-containing protein [Pseudomonadota bacterium]
MTDLVEDTKRLTLSRRYKAPRDLVWAVWTDPDHVAQWWGPFGPEKTSSDIQAKVGGVFLVNMTAPDGSQHPSRGIIREIEPPKHLVIEGDPGALDACGAGLPPRALITVTFEEVDGETELMLDAVFPSNAAREAAKDSGYLASWGVSLVAIEAYMDGIMTNSGVPA